MTTEITGLTEQGLQKEVTTMVDQAGHLVVKDAESLDVANEYLVNLSKLRKKRVAWFKPLVDAANLAHKALTKRRAEALEPIDKVDAVVRSITSVYVAKERVNQEKEQKRLDKLAEDKAEREEAKLLEKAEKEEDPEKKAELEEKAENVYVQPKIATPTVEKTSRVDGGGSVTFTTDIEIEITDVKAICNCIHLSRYPETLIEVKASKIKAYAKTVGMKPGKHVGFTIKEVQKQSVRGG